MQFYVMAKLIWALFVGSALVVLASAETYPWIAHMHSPVDGVARTKGCGVTLAHTTGQDHFTFGTGQCRMGWDLLLLFSEGVL